MNRPPDTTARYVLGLDLARSASGDFSAVVVDEISGDRASRHHDLRFIERWRGVPYPEQVERLRVLLESLGGSRTLAVDSTGVGGGIVDFLRRAALPAQLVPIVITGGLEPHTDDSGGRRVPKADMLAATALAFEAKRLRIAAGLRLADTLVRELENFRQTLSPSGRASYSAASGHHDDLVTAACLAVYVAETENLGGEEWLFADEGRRGGPRDRDFWSGF